MEFAATTRNAGSGSARNRRVLIVDDDHDFAIAVIGAVRLRGYTVEIAQTPESALSAIGTFRPEVLLIDVRPGIASGLELIPRIKASLPNAVCIIVTAIPDIETAIGAVRFKADDYLHKPLSPEEINKVLDYHLERTTVRNGEIGAKPANGARPAYPRDNSFGRLLVQRFSHLFFDPATAPSNNGPIPRRVLPGFFAAVEMMLGAERVEKNQQICNEAVAKLSQREALSGEKAWDAFYADEGVAEIAVETEMLMAAHFKNFDRRAEWFTNVILNNGPSTNGRTDETKASWPPSEKAVMMMLSALFTDLRSAISDDGKQRRIAKEFGEREIRLFANVVDEAQRRSRAA